VSITENDSFYGGKAILRGLTMQYVDTKITSVNLTQRSSKGKLLVFFLMMMLVCTAYSSAALQNSLLQTGHRERAIVWDVTMTFHSLSSQTDYVVFGEAPDANDGPPVDLYDTVKPPAPMPPFVRVWLNDNLPIPYNLLWRDYRHYPAVSKVWNLSVQWVPSDYVTPTTITISWSRPAVNLSEYDSVQLCTNSGTLLVDMKTNNGYSFECPANVPQTFKIICSGEGNNPPVANPDSYSTNEDTTLTVAAPGVLGNDNDPDNDSLTAIKVTDPSHGSVTLNANGGFTYIPTGNYHGSDSFTYKAYDGVAYSSVVAVTITVNSVNDPPVAYPDSYSTNEDTTLTVPAPGVLGNDVDVDGDTLTAVKITDPSHGTVTLNSNGGLTYIPSANYHGSDSFTYKAYDGVAYSNIATVTITVNSVNDPPVANPDSYSTDEDVVLTVPAPGVLANDGDIDGDSLTAVKVSDPTHGSVNLGSDGGFTYTPAANYHGSDSFTYKDYDGAAYSNVVAVTITVNAVNDPPVAYPDSYSTNEDTTLTVPAPGVLGNDVDVDGDSLTAVKVSDPAHGTVVVNSDGGFTYTPTPSYQGADSFTYKAYDGVAYSNVANVTITVSPVNHPPVAHNDTATVLFDSSNNKINVLANDNDPDGDTLTITGVSAAAHGTTTTDGSFVYYSPTHGYSGPDSFTYTISDGHGGTDTATVTITVQPNAAPLQPPRPTGPPSGKIKTEYTYNATTTDPNNDQVYYQWDWGDGTTSEWLGPYDSGQLTQAKHTWTKKGDYGIKVKAKDSYGAESNWSEPLSITMPLSSHYIMHEFGVLLQLIIRFLRGEFAGMTFLQLLRTEGTWK
jgi:VCBS repeat-containing protein